VCSRLQRAHSRWVNRDVIAIRLEDNAQGRERIVHRASLQEGGRLCDSLILIRMDKKGLPGVLWPLWSRKSRRSQVLH
jgi:hypothetical protein